MRRNEHSNLNQTGPEPIQSDCHNDREMYSIKNDVKRQIHNSTEIFIESLKLMVQIYY